MASKVCSSMMFAQIASVILFLSSPVLGFFRMSCSVVQMGRIDPVLSFGTVSQHVHKISGANNINVNSTYDSLQEAECTSCEVQADKCVLGHVCVLSPNKYSPLRSAYWTPQLYYQHANGSFEEVSNGGMAIYYLGRGADPAGNTVASPFPAGLKMLSGNNNARSFDNTTMTYSGDPNNPPTQVANRVTFACIDYNSPQAETPYMANTNCPDGLRAQIDFQSCWDGVNLYLSDQSHVDYLSSIDNGVCSPDYPVLLPHLFFEILYSVTNIVQDGGLFTFANGDETGYGFHGDFVNGWDLDVLSQAIDQCLLSDDGVIADCAPLAVSDDVNFATDCVETSPVFPCEPVHGMIGALPGCITPTGLDQPAENTCANGNVAACPPNYSNGPPAPYAGNGEYSYVGCYTEATSDRALSGSSESIPTMTAETCITFCEGAEYVGVEYGVECYCGTSLGSGSIAAAASDCAMTCGGSRWELCGGPNRLNLYKHT